MAKKVLIGLGMIIIIVLLMYIALQPRQVVITTPTETSESPTPRLEVGQEEPTPRAPVEPEPLPPGPSMQDVQPQDVNFFVNTIRVPVGSDYETYNFIPIRKSDIKTFAGSFGPYDTDPLEHVTAFLCSENSKVPMAPSCQKVPLIFKDKYANFAVGFTEDEYIGGLAAKDYFAYFVVKIGDTNIGYSNRAVIRTVND